MDLRETLRKRKRIHTGKAVHFSVDEITLPNGKKATREYLEHPGAVAVIPFMDKDHIVLVRQYRYPIGAVTWELPAGKLDAGETPSACVKRELEEETGLAASRVKKLVSFWPTPAFSNEVLHIFQAAGLKEARKNPDEDEFIEHAVLPVSTALAWIKSGKIRDSKTIIGLLYWRLASRR